MNSAPKRARSVSEYSTELWASHTLELRESRLKKALNMIDVEPRGRLLDIGCGHGEFGALLVGRGWKVAGVDLDPLQIAEASKRGLEATQCDLTHGLPHESGTFDVVFAGEVIEHIVDTDAFLAEVARVLKPGGAFVLTTPNLASFENRVRLLLGIYPIWVDHRLGGMGHVRAYTPGVLRRQLATHGLIVEKHRGNWVPFVPQRFLDDVKAPWLAASGDWLPGLAMDILMKARRRDG